MRVARGGDVVHREERRARCRVDDVREVPRLLRAGPGLGLEACGALLHLEGALGGEGEAAADERPSSPHRHASTTGQAADAAVRLGDALLHPGGVETELDEERGEGARHQAAPEGWLLTETAARATLRPCDASRPCCSCCRASSLAARWCRRSPRAAHSGPANTGSPGPMPASVKSSAWREPRCMGRPRTGPCGWNRLREEAIELVWPPRFSARFDPDLEVLDHLGRVAAREGTPVTEACLTGDPDVLSPDLYGPA